MGRKSTLDLMPPEVRAKLDALLSSPAYTQAQITAWMNELLAEIGEEPVMTERIVNRYARTFNNVLRKKQESNEVMKVWLSKLGDIPDGDFGRGIVEILRTLSFDFALASHEAGVNPEDLPGSVRMLKELAFAVEKIERAASENQKRETEIRKKAREEAVETVVKTAKADGVSPETIERIRRDVLGMAA